MAMMMLRTECVQNEASKRHRAGTSGLMAAFFGYDAYVSELLAAVSSGASRGFPISPPC